MKCYNTHYDLDNLQEIHYNATRTNTLEEQKVVATPRQIDCVDIEGLFCGHAFACVNALLFGLSRSD